MQIDDSRLVLHRLEAYPTGFMQRWGKHSQMQLTILRLSFLHVALCVACPLLGSPPDPLDWLLADERRQMIRLALARLPERDAEMLLLKYTENWSYHQIAAHLGVSHSAVEARLHRARRRLRGELAALKVIEA